MGLLPFGSKSQFFFFLRQRNFSAVTAGAGLLSSLLVLQYHFRERWCGLYQFFCQPTN
ncbi:hypothetical protein L218DRAFT_725398 [Marasmius fiardii PR-910]|nr:hypothetical protein L218DRAFT_725398 [Marasmius fiardii PR-910]